jgi:hypothetical protein
MKIIGFAKATMGVIYASGHAIVSINGHFGAVGSYDPAYASPFERAGGAIRTLSR